MLFILKYCRRRNDSSKAELRQCDPRSGAYAESNRLEACSITERLGISDRGLQDPNRKAKSRGWDPAVDLTIQTEHVEDAARSGRTPALNDEQKQEIPTEVRKSRTEREKPVHYIASRYGVSAPTITKFMHSAGLKRLKYTVKPGLTAAMKKARLDFCIFYKDWALEDWKDVIWSDESGVVIGQRSGMVRAWRTPEERYETNRIRPRWLRLQLSTMLSLTRMQRM